MSVCAPFSHSRRPQKTRSGLLVPERWGAAPPGRDQRRVSMPLGITVTASDIEQTGDLRLHVSGAGDHAARGPDEPGFDAVNGSGQFRGQPPLMPTSLGCVHRGDDRGGVEGLQVHRGVCDEPVVCVQDIRSYVTPGLETESGEPMVEVEYPGEEVLGIEWQVWRGRICTEYPNTVDHLGSWGTLSMVGDDGDLVAEGSLSFSQRVNMSSESSVDDRWVLPGQMAYPHGQRAYARACAVPSGSRCECACVQVPPGPIVTGDPPPRCVDGIRCCVPGQFIGHPIDIREMIE